MRSLQAIKSLTEWERQGRVVFTYSDLRKVFRHDSDPAFRSGLASLTRNGVLQRVGRGVFVFALAKLAGAHILERIAVALRRGAWSYLSLESALSEWGAISQVPLGGLTVMTTGRRGEFLTPFGRVEFTHTAKQPGDILAQTTDVGRPLRLARPEWAARDLRRVGRNVGMIDEAALLEAINDAG